MLKAIIFDFDGVITDSEPVHLKMFQKVLSEIGVSLNEKEYYDVYLGLDDKGCFTALFQSRGIDTHPDLIQSLIKKKSSYLMEYIKNDLFIYPGVVDFVEKAQKKYHLAIASGALRHEIEFVLNRAGILPAFKVIVSAEDVRGGKPDPECFNKALKKLNETYMPLRGTKEHENRREQERTWVPGFFSLRSMQALCLDRGLRLKPNTQQEFSDERGRHQIKSDECLVIEDSIAGIDAAHAAGMKCIAVTNTYSHEKLGMADIVVKSLEEIRFEVLESLIK